MTGQKSLDNQVSADETGLSRENCCKAFRKAIIDEAGNSCILIAAFGY